MLCYRDMTFCPFWQECTRGKECHRALTEEVVHAAKVEGLDICSWSEEPGCYESTVTTTNTTD